MDYTDDTSDSRCYHDASSASFSRFSSDGDMDEGDTCMDASNSSYTFLHKKPRSGFIRFMREFSRSEYGVDLVELSILSGRAWNKLSSSEKSRYHRQAGAKRCLHFDRHNRCHGDDMDDMDEMDDDVVDMADDHGDDDDDGCDSMPCCSKRKPRCAPKPSCCPKRKPRCAPKPSCCPKPRCAPKPRCPRPRKPCCPRKRRRTCKPRCQNPGPMTNNGFLNFLRTFRRKNCGLTPKEMVMRAARAWCRLPENKKDRYRRQAYVCGKRKCCKDGNAD
ncbi:hypothetical protein KR222_009537 [Zaprionus bogoriensis]|nr:hypothetical protein KR222_009537 [Zaprionus bogoriensis]